VKVDVDIEAEVDTQFLVDEVARMTARGDICLRGSYPVNVGIYIRNYYNMLATTFTRGKALVCVRVA
jgi:hypothetical protein